MADSKKLHNLLENHTDLYGELMGLFKGNEEEALSWLTKPKVPLCNASPISLLADTVGKAQVMDMLYRIKTGDIS